MRHTCSDGGCFSEAANPPVGQIHLPFDMALIGSGDHQPVPADVKVEQVVPVHVGERRAQWAVDVHVGGSEADLTAVQAAAQQVQPRLDPVACRKRLTPQAVSACGHDRVHDIAEPEPCIVVPRRRDVGNGEQRAGHHVRPCRKPVKEAGVFHQSLRGGAQT